MKTCNHSLRSKERPYLAHLERKRFRKMLIPAFAGTGASPCMLRFFETVFVQPALKSDRSPSVNSTFRAVTKTLYDKIWEQHQVCDKPDGTSIIYIDRHLIHEVTSPQAFEGLAVAGRKIRRPETILAVSDHNVPTQNRRMGIIDDESRIQVGMLQDNCKQHGIHYIELLDKRQGIVHIIGPEQGFTLPGTTIVCGDSHTSTHL